MHIHDFHSKFVSSNEECHLFEALRSLSQVENLQAVFDDATTMGDWTTWPPMDAHASEAASMGV
jgi:hypothetical protein